MSTTSYIKCPNCGVFNTNKDYCKNCNALISSQKKRAIATANAKEEELAEAIVALEKTNIADRMKEHPFFLVKFFGWILHSVWLLLNIIAGFIAWFVAMVAAG